MPVIRTPALILHSFPYGDTSRILRILTPDYGLRSVIAKGASRPKSRFGAILEPFTEGEAQFNLREGSELFTLTAFSLTRSRQGIGSDLTAFAAASLIAEIALGFGTEEPNPHLYDHLAVTLDRLADARHPSAATSIQSLWYLVSLLGYQPEMVHCVRCGRPIGAGERATVDARAGGAVCIACAPQGRALDPTLRREIETMTDTLDWTAAVSVPPLHAALLGHFISTHLASNRGLRAFPLFVEQIG